MKIISPTLYWGLVEGCLVILRVDRLFHRANVSYYRGKRPDQGLHKASGQSVIAYARLKADTVLPLLDMV